MFFFYRITTYPDFLFKKENNVFPKVFSMRMIAQHITGFLSIKKQKKEAKTKQYVFFLYDNDHTNYFTEFPSLTVDNTVKIMKQEGMQK